MTAAVVALVIVAALVGQATLGLLIAPSGYGINLVLVAVVFLGLTRGPVVGLLSGTVAGLVQDAMGSGIVGLGGLAKTVVGYATGVVGAQFIVARPMPRFVVFFGATLAEAAIVTTLLWLLNMRSSGAGAAVVLQRAVGQALVGVVLFQLTENVPKMLDRRRAIRSRTRTVRLK